MIRRYIEEVFNGHDLDGLDQYWAADLVSHWMGQETLRGLPAWKRRDGRLLCRLPGRDLHPGRSLRRRRQGRVARLLARHPARRVGGGRRQRPRGDAGPSSSSAAWPTASLWKTGSSTTGWGCSSSSARSPSRGKAQWPLARLWGRPTKTARSPGQGQDSAASRARGIRALPIIGPASARASTPSSLRTIRTVTSRWPSCSCS